MKSLIFLILSFLVLQTKYITAQITFTRNCPNFQINIQKSGSSNPTTIGSLITYSDCSSSSGFYVGKNGSVLKRAVWQWNISDTDIPDGSTIHSVTIKLRKSTGPSEININYFDVGLNISDPNLNLTSLWDLTDKNLNTPIGSGHGNNSTNNIVSSTFTNSSDPFIIALLNSLVNDRFSLGFAWTQDSPSSGDNEYLFFRNEPCLTISFTPPNQSVTLDQRLSNNQQVGVLRKWEGTQFTPYPYITPGTAFNFLVNSTQTILGDQSVYSNQKYNNWNSDKTDVRNHHEFLVNTQTNILTSKFEGTNFGVTIKNNLLENPSLDGGTLFFRDPWFIDYPDPAFGNTLRNGGMDQASWRNRTSPFYPDATTSYENGQKYNGVFLNQNIEEGKPYYKLWAGDQLINLGSPLGIRTFYFQDWSATGATLQQYGSDANVVFTSGNAVVQANYKGHLLSNDQYAVSSSSQRKFVKTDNGIYHLVYESMGAIWYTHSLTSNINGDWSEDQLIEYGKNPSIARFENKLRVAYEYCYPLLDPHAVIFILSIEPDVNGNYVFGDSEPFVTYPTSYYGNAKPVIVYTNIILYVAYRKNTTDGIYEKTRWTVGTPYTGNETQIPYTTSNSRNPSIMNKASNGIYIAYEHSFSIRYIYSGIQGQSWEYSNYATISTGSGFSINAAPSISLAGQGYPIVSWVGTNVGEDTVGLGKQTGIDGSSSTSQVVVRRGHGTWSAFLKAGSNVKSTNNNSVTGITDEASVITWSEGTSPNNLGKWLRRYNGSYSGTHSLSHNGKQNQVSNGTSLDNMKGMVFSTATTPYNLAVTTTDFNQIFPEEEVPTNKITDYVELSYGREGVIVKNGVEFLFNIGDVIVGDSVIKFIEQPDTLIYASTEELNQVVKTEPFYLSANTEFLFTDFYYVLNSDKADTALTENDLVNFKAELVNSTTGEIVGTFDNITYTKQQLEKHDNISYQVDCENINPGYYYLRLNTAIQGDAEIVLGNIQNSSDGISKKTYNAVNFNGLANPETYDLAQNYPNPFNPTTIISYQIPKDGLVTIKVYDILGKEVTTLVNENKSVGRYSVQFNGDNLASGVYVYRITSGDFVSSKKMMLIK